MKSRNEDDYVAASNADAWALGEVRRGRFHVRRVVWGRLLARYEKRDGEHVRRVRLMIRTK